jgi:hypothetical protein
VTGCCGRPPGEGYAHRRPPPTVSTMAANRTLAGLLALGTLVLAPVGEGLVLTHTAGALGLILLVCGAALGVAGWVALGAPRRRSDISA